MAVAATALDLAFLGMRYNSLVPPALDLAPPPVLRPLLANPERETFRVIAMAGDLVPNLSALYGLADPRVYDPMHPWAAREVIGRALRSGDGLVAVLDPGTIAVGSRNVDAPARPMLDYLGVRYMLVRPAGRLPLPWKRAWTDTGGRMWENPAAMPLFTMPARVERVASREEAIARAGANRDFRAVGFVERDGEGAPVAGGSSPPALRGLAGNAGDARGDRAGTGGCVRVAAKSRASRRRSLIDVQPRLHPDFATSPAPVVSRYLVRGCASPSTGSLSSRARPGASSVAVPPGRHCVVSTTGPPVTGRGSPRRAALAAAVIAATRRRGAAGSR